MVINSRSAYEACCNTDTYKFVRTKYLHFVEEKIFKAINNGRFECSVNLLRILGINFFRYKETLFAIIFKEYNELGFNVHIKLFSAQIDWIREVFENIKPNTNNKEESSNDDNEDYMTTGEPRIIESKENNEEEESAVFTPKKLKMHIGFRI